MTNNLAPSRRNSLRKPGYDYAQPGWYFVTTCTQRREHLFGEINAGQMASNDIGAMVTDVWESLPDSFSGIQLNRFQLMPDHIHGILFLGTDPTTPANYSLGSIVRYFKGRSTTHYFAGVRDGGWPRVDGQLWQRGFHDRIIRSETELEHIRAYIESNPGRWWTRFTEQS